MSYVKNKQLGYNKAQTLIIPIDNGDIYNNLNSFKTELQNSNRRAVCFRNERCAWWFFDGQTFDVEGHTEKWNANTEFADFEFVKSLGLKIIAGRDFSSQFPTDTTEAVLINKTAAAKLGWTPQQAIGKWIFNSTWR